MVSLTPKLKNHFRIVEGPQNKGIENVKRYQIILCQIIRKPPGIFPGKIPDGGCGGYGSRSERHRILFQYILGQLYNKMPEFWEMLPYNGYYFFYKCFNYFFHNFYLYSGSLSRICSFALLMIFRILFPSLPPPRRNILHAFFVCISEEAPYNFRTWR